MLSLFLECKIAVFFIQLPIQILVADSKLKFEKNVIIAYKMRVAVLFY